MESKSIFGAIYGQQQPFNVFTFNYNLYINSTSYCYWRRLSFPAALPLQSYLIDVSRTVYCQLTKTEHFLLLLLHIKIAELRIFFLHSLAIFCVPFVSCAASDDDCSWHDGKRKLLIDFFTKTSLFGCTVNQLHWLLFCCISV